VVLRDGRIEQVGAPLDLYRNPDNKFVAGFIGSPSMNFVYGTLTAENGSNYVGWADTKLRVDQSTLDARPGLADYAGREIVVGLRPEAFEAKAAMTSEFDSQRVMSIHVDLVEQLGSEAYLHFEQPLAPVITPDIQELLADQGSDASVLGETTAFTARVNPDFAPRAGDQTELVVETEKLHFFDKETGEAIR
jgi:multiple sugar transport system ATP-binding protein